MSNPVLFASFGTPDPDGAQALEEYASSAVPLLTAVGAKPRVRAKVAEQLVGETELQTVFVVEFPSRESVDAVFDSDAYKALIPARSKAFKTLHFLILEEF
ncbi:MAG: DUF1330 domain-containing protein [Pseudomonadota bacterium]